MSSGTRALFGGKPWDPAVSMAQTLLAWSIARLLLVAVYPAWHLRETIWVLLAVGLGWVIGLATYRRDATLLWTMLLGASGAAAVVVGIGYPLYMTIYRPSLMESSTYVVCLCYAASGLAAQIAATRFRKSGEAAVPPNTSLERAREE